MQAFSVYILRVLIYIIYNFITNYRIDNIKEKVEPTSFLLNLDWQAEALFFIILW